MPHARRAERRHAGLRWRAVDAEERQWSGVRSVTGSELDGSTESDELHKYITVVTVCSAPCDPGFHARKVAQIALIVGPPRRWTMLADVVAIGRS